MRTQENITWATRPFIILRTIPLLIAVCLVSFPAKAQYGGGTGEPNNPYLIYTVKQMNVIGLHEEDWDKHFKIMDDIDFSVYDEASFNIIGTYGVPFTGVFDGNGHVISNFSISRNSSPVGMFGCVNDLNAQIKDLGLIDPFIDEEHRRYVGALVGSLREGTVSSCYVKGGSVSGDHYVGGLVGENRGTIVDCNSTANVSGDYGVGGLVGDNRAFIIGCCSSGDVSGWSVIGGLSGENYGTVVECYATGAVSGINSGGLVGLNRPGATIRSCYSHGDTSGQRYIGGLVGRDKGKIVTCYSMGLATGTTYVGGLVGLSDVGQVYSSLWDVQTSGHTASDGGWGKTTAEMQRANTFAGWGRDAIWTINEGADYPKLAWQDIPGKIIATLYGGGSGAEGDPYLIYTPEQLDEIGVYPEDWDKHFRLIADLDLAGLNINPIGHWAYSHDDEDAIPFEGTFDGNGKTISNLRRNGISGVFEYVDGTHADIRDLTLTDPNLHGGFIGSLVGRLYGGTIRGCIVIGGHVSGKDGDYLYTNVGGLIGVVRDSVIKNCFSSASVTGSDYVGGLVGQSADNTIIMNCEAIGTVQARKKVGGLVGLCKDDTLIMNCGATGTVHGDSAVGGLVGCSEATVIAGSFASGNVSVGKTQIGGLVGDVSYSRIICCYAAGNVSGGNGVAGGLVGDISASYIADSYSTGQVSGEYAGGFSGDDWARTYNCFWDIESSQMSTSGLGTGLTTNEIQDPNTFTGPGWDFVGESANGPSDIWVMPETGSYPILTWQVSPLPPLPTFSAGTGEPNDPFVVRTPEELNSIGHNPRLMSSHFKLANDIDLAGVNFFLMGSEGYPFRGVFDGNGHAIWNFSHEASRKYSNYVGLFRYIRDSKAEIRNLVLSHSYVVNEVDLTPTDEDYVGSLVGLLYEGTVVKCHVEDSEVSVKESDYVGGLIGYNRYGLIEACSSTATMTGGSDLGGLLGCNRSGIVIDCHSLNSVVKGYLRVGGLAGSNWACIVDCSSSGNVSGWHTIGGLSGWNLNTIVTSCSYGDTEGSLSVGGLVGENLGRISHCYARGVVSGGEYIGGLVGDNTYRPRISGSIVTSYSTGFVSGKGNVAGLAYKSDTSATTGEDCFWDIQTSGQTTNDGAVGKTTAEMQTASTFLGAGWDFVDEIENGTEDIWWIDKGQDYPRLWWELIEDDSVVR